LEFSKSHFQHQETLCQKQFLMKHLNISFNPHIGGNQGARGWFVNATGQCLGGGDYFIENFKEALDFPNEFYFDADRKKLYVVANSTWDDNTAVVIPKLDILFTIGKKAEENNREKNQEFNDTTPPHPVPVKAVTIANLKLRDARPTFLDPHGVPSAGDWALQQSAAILLQNTERVTIQDNLFKRLDGNGILLLNSNVETLISRNEFAFIGDTAMAAWGETEYMNGIDKIDKKKPVPAKLHAKYKNQPRNTYILHNVVREVGYYEKQSSAWFQAKTSNSILFGNLFFNGPRAGVNFNDNFGGGNLMLNNIIFNQCRETADHGPVNAWDRMPFLYLSESGTWQLAPEQLPNTIAKNFILANGNAMVSIDNDDGSGFFEIHSNFFPSSGGLKNDFGGRAKVFDNNLIVSYPEVTQLFGWKSYPCVQMDIDGGFYTKPELKDIFRNNVCIRMEGKTNHSTPVIKVQDARACSHEKIKNQNSSSEILKIQVSLHGNIYGTLSGVGEVKCGSDKVDWQTNFVGKDAAKLNEKGSKIFKIDTEKLPIQVISYAEKLLMGGDHVSWAKSIFLRSDERLVSTTADDGAEVIVFA